MSVCPLGLLDLSYFVNKLLLLKPAREGVASVAYFISGHEAK